MRKRNPESRYREKIRHEQTALEDFASHEIDFSENLLAWFRIKHREPGDEEYRGICYFQNREFLLKPGSLTLLYATYEKLIHELPEVNRENAFDLLRYRFKIYAHVLEKGGFNV
jgi:hypothetical protein